MRTCHIICIRTQNDDQRGESSKSTKKSKVGSIGTGRVLEHRMQQRPHPVAVPVPSYLRCLSQLYRAYGVKEAAFCPPKSIINQQVSQGEDLGSSVWQENSEVVLNAPLSLSPGEHLEFSISLSVSWARLFSAGRSVSLSLHLYLCAVCSGLL